MVSELEREPTGVDGLDGILGGGLLRGGIYILRGSPGAGKTILANQICFNHVKHGGRAAFVTLLAESHTRMLQHLRPMSFFDQDAIPDRLYYVSGFDALETAGLKGVVDLIRREIRGHRATLLVLDGFLATQESAQNDREFKKFIHEIQSHAAINDCTVLLLTNSTLPEGRPEHTMVDGLINLEERSFDYRTERKLSVVKFRGSDNLRGQHSFRITDSGLVVFPRVEVALAEPTRPIPSANDKVSTGIPGLDAMVGGGLPFSSTTGLLGPSGAGKTTVGLHFAGLSSAAEPGLFFGFYEAPERLLAKAQRLGIDLDGPRREGVLEFLWNAQTEGIIDEIAYRLLENVRRRGVKRLFLDGLGGLMEMAAQPERISRFFSVVVNELRALGVTTIYTMETMHIIGSDMQLPIRGLSSLVENMLVMRYVEIEGQFSRLLSVTKVRDSGFDPALREFEITDRGLRVGSAVRGYEAVLSGYARDKTRRDGVPTPRPKPARRNAPRDG